MSFFKNVFSGNSRERKTGVFVNGDEGYEELDEMPSNGSINSIIEYTGYNTNQVHSVIMFSSKLLSNLGVKVFTKEVVFFMTEKNVSPLTEKQIQNEIKKIDWEFEYSSMECENILKEAIENKAFNHKFLVQVLDISEDENLGFYYSASLGYYLYFEEGILTDFDTASGLSSEAKWLYDLNPSMYDNMLKEAMRFQDSKAEAIEEVNIQCHSLQMIPKGVDNQYIPHFKSEYGNMSFYNIYVKYYSESCEISEFIKMNKGRYQSASLDGGAILTVGKNNFQFDENGFFQR